jgi:hypothetical protein
MSTAAKAFQAFDAADERRGGVSGLFERAFRHLVAAREASARNVTETHLARLSDETLVELGYDPGEVRRIKARADYDLSYWI